MPTLRLWPRGDQDGLSERAHREIHRVRIRWTPKTRRPLLEYTTWGNLPGGGEPSLDGEGSGSSQASATLHDVDGPLAIGVIQAGEVEELVQMVLVSGEWKVVNALWASRDPGGQMDGQPSGSPESAALDYIEGAFSGNGDRMARALHPELHKVRLNAPASGREFLTLMGASDLIEWTREGILILPEAEREIRTDVLFQTDEVATVKVTSSKFLDYLQLAVIDGEWRIINVLWIPW